MGVPKWTQSAKIASLLLAAISASGSVIKFLIEHDADPNARTAARLTPLLFVVTTRLYEWPVESLLKGGDDVNARTCEGEQPLNILVKSATYRGIPNKPETCVRMLLADGADVNLAYRLKRPPILHALRSPRGFSLFKFLYSRGAKVDVVDSDGNSILHYLALYGTLKQIRYLGNGRLENVDPGLLNNENRSPLSCFEWRKMAEKGDLAPGIAPPGASEVAAF